MPSSFDSNQYKKGQRQGWDSIAEGWQKWWKTFEHDAQKANKKLVELAEIEEGDRVLDIATGIGEPAITAAKKLVLKVMFWQLIYHQKCYQLQNKEQTLLDYKI